MNRDEALRILATVLSAMGAEKLPGRLRGEPKREDVLQALAFVRCEIDEIESVLLKVAS